MSGTPPVSPAPSSPRTAHTQHFTCVRPQAAGRRREGILGRVMKAAQMLIVGLKIGVRSGERGRKNKFIHPDFTLVNPDSFGYDV